MTGGTFVGDGSGVNVRVGSGVMVNVGAEVNVGSGVSLGGAGWNGVGVGEAPGFCVTRTKDGKTGAEGVADAHPASKVNSKTVCVRRKK